MMGCFPFFFFLMVFKGLGLKDKKMIKKEKVKEEVNMLVRKKKVASVAAAVGVKEKKKEKKVYDLPGQKHDPPEEVSVAFLFVWELDFALHFNLWLSGDGFCCFSFFRETH